MVFKAYSAGAMFACLIMLIGAMIYIKHENIDAFGAKAMILGGVILGAIVWPISMPGTAVFILKMLLTKATHTLARDAEEVAEEVTE